MALDLGLCVALLRDKLPKDTIVCNGAGNFSGWMHRYWRYAATPCQLAPTSGTMGYGLPAAVAASLRFRDRQVLCVAGDGDFLMNGQELATAAQYGADLLVLIVDNGSYGTIRMHQERDYPERLSATTLANPDFAALGRAFGAWAATVERTEEFGPALDEAMALQGPSPPPSQDRRRGDHQPDHHHRAAGEGAGLIAANGGSRMRMVLRIAALLLAFGEVPAAAQVTVLPLRERAVLHDKLLAERLDTIVPALMREQKIDMWVLVAREYVEDPVLATMLDAESLHARRRTILVFFDPGPGKPIERLTVSRYGLGGLFQPAWNPEAEPDQWKALAQLIAHRDPKRIAINASASSQFADGLTLSQFEGLTAALSPAYRSRLVRTDELAVGWLETRTPAEMQVYRQLLQVTHAIIAEALSDRVIVAGKTTANDVRWWMREKVSSLGLEVWFHPSLSIFRQGQRRCPQDDEVIRPGDLLWTDFGITYLGLNSDVQQLGYVLKPGERDAPKGLHDGLLAANRVQDALTTSFRTGLTGNEILAAARAKAIASGLSPSIYSHPIGFHGHGAGSSIGFWDNQKADPRGERPLRPDTAWSIELNAKAGARMERAGSRLPAGRECLLRWHGGAVSRWTADPLPPDWARRNEQQGESLVTNAPLHRRTLLTGAGALATALALPARGLAAAVAEQVVRRPLPPPISAAERAGRLKRAQQLLRANRLGAMLIESGPSLDYYTGIQWWRSERLTGVVVPAEGDPIIVTPFFERPSIAEQLEVPAEIRTWQEDEEPLKLVADFMRERKVTGQPVAFEETNRFFLGDRLATQLPGARIVNANAVVRAQRMIKSPAEIALMQAASDITIAAFRQAHANLKAGMSFEEIDAAIGAATAALGGSGGGNLVLIGDASALPHGSRSRTSWRPATLSSSMAGAASTAISRTSAAPSSSTASRRQSSARSGNRSTAASRPRLPPPGSAPPPEASTTPFARPIKLGIRPGLQTARPLPPHRPRDRHGRPRAGQSGPRRDHAPGPGHVLLERARNLPPRPLRRPARGLLPHDRDRPEVVHHPAAEHRPAVRLRLGPPETICEA